MRLALGIDQDIGRLEVAVQDAVLMSVVDRIADGGHQAGRFPCRQRSLGH